MKIHLLDDDPRIVTDAENYPTNHGSFSEVMINLNKALEKLGYYAEPDNADFVGKCDGLQIGFKYKNKKSFVISVWETVNSLPINLLRQAQGEIVFGLSNQITKLWHKYGFHNVKTVYGGCDTEFWKPTIPKSNTFTFLHVNSSNVRSGLDLTIKAFHKAFQGNKKAQLLIKDTNNSPKLLQVIQEYRNKGCNIEYISKRMHSYELRDLYSSSHVCLNLLRMTSFGMPLLESSACGCLCVTGNFSPTNEIINHENGILINPVSIINIGVLLSELTEVWGLLNCYPNFGYIEEPQFYHFDYLEYATILENLFINWDYYQKINTRKSIVENWKWEDSAKQLIKYLKGY